MNRRLPFLLLGQYFRTTFNPVVGFYQGFFNGINRNFLSSTLFTPARASTAKLAVNAADAQNTVGTFNLTFISSAYTRVAEVRHRAINIPR